MSVCLLVHPPDAGSYNLSKYRDISMGPDALLPGRLEVPNMSDFAFLIAFLFCFRYALKYMLNKW